MTYTDVLTLANALGDDAIVMDWSDRIDVKFNDFEGFDDDWSEIFRDFDNEDAIDAFLGTLRANALSVDDSYYVTFYFDGFRVVTGYTSYDI